MKYKNVVDKRNESNTIIGRREIIGNKDGNNKAIDNIRENSVNISIIKNGNVTRINRKKY